METVVLSRLAGSFPLLGFFDGQFGLLNFFFLLYLSLLLFVSLVLIFLAAFVAHCSSPFLDGLPGKIEGIQALPCTT
jgi:hypothetical protein